MRKFLRPILLLFLICNLSVCLYSCGAGEANTSVEYPSSEDDSAGDDGSETNYNDSLEWINVKNPKFGAVGNGIVDDTIAIQNAIDSTISGDTIFFPAGKYKITSALRISKNGVHLKGSGMGASVIYNDSSTSDAFHFGSDTQQTLRCSISDMSISSSVAKSAGAAIRFGSDTNLNVRRCSAYNLHIDGHYDGIIIEGGIIIFLHDLILISGANHGTGILITGGNDHFLERITLWNYNVNIGIYSSGATWIDNVDAMKADTNGLEMISTDGNITWCWINNSAFDSSGNHGIFINSPSSYQIRGLNFGNVWASTSGSRGIYVSGGGTIDGIQFIGARVFNNQTHGAEISAGENITFDACHIGGNSRASYNTYDGIVFSNNVSEFSVRNCRIGPMAGFEDTQKSGINVSGLNSISYIIVGNDLRGNKYGLIDYGVSSDKIVANNLNIQ